MTPERWIHIRALFDQALDLPPGQRDAFLDQACDDDAQLRAKVEALLEADAQPPPILEASPDDLAALLPETTPPDQEGQQIGPYRLVQEIGHGGMGTVYLAERADDQFQKRVAIKLVKRGMDTDEILRRFRYERQILAGLEHPHIARLYDGGRADDGRPYLVMEYVGGQRIDRYCDERTLSVDERLKLFQTVCAAVQHAHQNLVVHRDLKPSNILVTDAGQVKLLDFGIAKLLDEEQAGLSRPMTRTGMRVMTPEYASPEQVQGAPVTTASDVYALGVVLYELLTGHRPYDLSEKSPLEVEQAVLEQAPERPSTAVTKVTERRHRDGTTEAVTPAAVSAARATSAERLQRRLRGDLDTILLKALQKEPERRYASAEAFLEDINRHLAGRPVEARPDTLGYRLRKFVQRHRLGVATAAVFVVLLVGFAVAMAFQQAATARQRDHARLEANKVSEVRDFLVGLFEASDPGRSRGQTITAQDLLERGADRIEELAVQPEIQAELMATLGEIYRRLGLYNQARSFLEQALTVRRTLYGLQHPDIALSLQGLGNVYYSLGDYDAAQRVFEEALSMHRSGSGTAPLTLAHSNNKLALTLYTKGNYDEAEPLFREALSMFRTLHGEDHPDVARTLNNLATLAYAEGGL